jgi:Holliday junction resolvase RusA-like endonuclease
MAFFQATIPLPASMNNTAAYRESRATLEAELGGFERLPDGDYEFTLTFHFPRDSRRRDVLNYTKTLPDVLSKVVGVDDSRFCPVHIYRGERGDSTVDITLSSNTE